MAYRIKQGIITRSATFKEEIPASAAPICHYKTKTLTSSYSFSSTSTSTSKGLNTLKDSRKKGLWGVLARKARAIFDDDSENLDTRPGVSTTQQKQQGGSDEGFRRTENPRVRRGSDKLNSSLNHIGDTFEKAFEEGRTIAENKTQKMRQKEAETQVADALTTTMQQQQQRPTLLELLNQNNDQTLLKASRDVALATTAKAKLLHRELKTVKADLAFAKEWCAQLQEEIKILRQSRDKGDTPEDDDLIRVQLESLLAEKARLAHENSIYARENRFLKEIVEYHQLNMQDVVYLDEEAEDVTDVEYPTNFSNLFESLPISPSQPCTTSNSTKDEISPYNIPTTRRRQEEKDSSNSDSQETSDHNIRPPSSPHHERTPPPSHSSNPNLVLYK